MRVTVLGSGDAIGTPKIGCSCPVCTEAVMTGRQRLRTSLLIEHQGFHLLIDSSPDLRSQLLAHGSPRIDAVIWTHGHYDHFMGFGEFYRVQKMPIVYAAPGVLEYCGGIFSFLPMKGEPFLPMVPFELFGLEILPVLVNHPDTYTCGLVIRAGGHSVGYTSDSRMDLPEETLQALRGVDLLFVDAIVPAGFRLAKHMNYPEAIRLAHDLSPKEFRCVHMSHYIPWETPYSAYDGESFFFPDAPPLHERPHRKGI